ncbi:MAG: GNAT family N-acetyltransferase [Chitinophagaceae bacterium]|nr:GNAT family N-acetyltransferase [Chitinophagaceae bacterium]
MNRATLMDKAAVVNLLFKSFENNKSVNYIVRQDFKRNKRIKSLMNYSFEMCYHYGEVFISEDKKGCALVLLPEKKKTNLHTIWLDIKLVIKVIGLAKISMVMKRESIVKKTQPDSLLYYLWFIGAAQEAQGTGIGSTMLKQLIKRANDLERTICLETSTTRNLPWYEKFGFKIYDKIDLGYELFFMKKG